MADNTPNTRTNRMRGLELAVSTLDPLESTADVLTRANAYAEYLHTGKIAEDKK